MTMDYDLQEAAYNGDVRFLRQAVATERSEYFLRRIEPPTPNFDDKAGNIIHIATLQDKEDFIREAIKSLPREHLLLLFTQQEPSRKSQNPLHFAAKRGYLGIIKIILEFYGGILLLKDSNYVKNNGCEKPWLACDSEGNTPLHVGLIENGNEECALEIMSMDLELLCNFEGEDDMSVLYVAVSRGCNRVALEILSFSPSYSVKGRRYGLNLLNFLPRSSG
ncbi:E3 ubiquitin-protein ligase MIB1 [Bienertia sinuspersici]